MPLLLGAFVVAVLAGCDDGAQDRGQDTLDVNTRDVGDVQDDAATGATCSIDEAPPDFTYPAGPYGGQVGDTFENFTLEDCDGNPVEFADILASAELVHFNVGAGWCEPCIEETRTLESDVVGPFCGRGLRVVQVLFQDEDGGAATRFFCRQWREEFGLTIPVLVDPLFTTSQYFEAAQTPLNLLIDTDGEILFRETGTVAADLPQRIDMLLPPDAP